MITFIIKEVDNLTILNVPMPITVQINGRL